MNAQHIILQEFLKLPCKIQNRELWRMVRIISDAIDDYYHHEYNTVPYQFITAKSIIIMIEIYIFAPERIKSFV